MLRVYVATLMLLVLSPLKVHAVSACLGDCNGDGKVMVNELLTMVSIALGVQDLASCTAGDSDGNHVISIDEIVRAVNNALFGCPPPAAIRGSITCPSSANLQSCQTGGVPVSVLSFGPVGAQERQAPPAIQPAASFQLNLIASSTTDSQGNYDTGDLTESLGDQTRPIIVLANVTTAATIGGVASLAPATTLTKALNATTQVGCVAAVALVLGTDAVGVTSACTVSDACGTQANCLPLLDPQSLDAERIGRLEAAAASISSDVFFPNDQAAAVCAVITCTDGGATDATSDCVTRTFQSNLG